METKQSKMSNEIDSRQIVEDIELSDLCFEVDNKVEERKPLDRMKLLLYGSRAVLYGSYLIQGLAEMSVDTNVSSSLNSLSLIGIFSSRVDFKIKSAHQTIYSGLATLGEYVGAGSLYILGRVIAKKYL